MVITVIAVTDGRLLVWPPDPILSGHTPVGEVTLAAAEQLRSRTAGGTDARWGELAAELVRFRHRRDVDLTDATANLSTPDIEVAE